MKSWKCFFAGTTIIGIIAYCMCKISQYLRYNQSTVHPCVKEQESSPIDQEVKRPNKIPEMVEISRSTKKRLERNDKFKEFYEKAKEIFDSLGCNDKNAEDYRNFNMLCVCPGSRAGGQEQDIVEVFWGSRLMETGKKATIGGVRFEAKYEYGATMLFTKQENGFVSVYLQPSHVNYKKPEECIIWKKSVDPAKLLKPWYQKYLWGGFMSYMEVTSTDGNPSCLQRTGVFAMRLFHPIIEEVTKPYPYTDKDGVVQITEISESFERPIRFIQGIQSVIKWVFQVSLSGVLIFLIPILFPKESDEAKKLKCLEKQIEMISLDVKQKNADLHSIENKLDSINMSIQRKCESEKHN